MEGDKLSKNDKRRQMYAFKADLEKVIKLHNIDKISGIPAQFLASYLLRQYIAIETLLENLDI